jgi:hypothetical protein
MRLTIQWFIASALVLLLPALMILAVPVLVFVFVLLG